MNNARKKPPELFYEDIKFTMQSFTVLFYSVHSDRQTIENIFLPNCFMFCVVKVFQNSPHTFSGWISVVWNTALLSLEEEIILIFFIPVIPFIIIIIYILTTII